MQARSVGRHPGGYSRRTFLLGAGAALGALAAANPVGRVEAEQEEPAEQWVANHVETRLVDAAGVPVAWLPQWTRLRLERPLGGGMLEVWAPRAGVVGRVPASQVGPVQVPSATQLAAERATGLPPLIGKVGLPARTVGGANLRQWPAVDNTTLLRSLPHNAPLRVLTEVQGADGEAWHHVNLLDSASLEPVAAGYVHHSLVRLPRLRLPVAPDRADQAGRWFEADLQEPAMLVAFEDGAPLWASLTIKGRATSRTRLGEHRILRRVEREIMNSETLFPPIPRNAPGGYYLKDVLYTQYFYDDGASIHYNYWHGSFGYAGSNGCLGLPLQESRLAWDFAEVGTRLVVFA